MKKTEGYVTEDGTFFEREQEAKLHEAEWRLRHRLSNSFPELNQERFFNILLMTAEEIGGYLDAYSTTERDLAKDEDRREAEATQAEVDDGLGHVTSAEEDLASLLKLPPGRPLDVSNVGRRSRTKKVSDGREKHGP